MKVDPRLDLLQQLLAGRRSNHGLRITTVVETVAASFLRKA